MWLEVSGAGFRIRGFRICVKGSGLGLRVKGLEVKGLGFEVRVYSSRLQVEDLRCSVVSSP